MCRAVYTRAKSRPRRLFSSLSLEIGACMCWLAYTHTSARKKEDRRRGKKERRKKNTHQKSVLSEFMFMLIFTQLQFVHEVTPSIESSILNWKHYRQRSRHSIPTLVVVVFFLITTFFFVWFAFYFDYFCLSIWNNCRISAVWRNNRELGANKIYFVSFVLTIRSGNNARVSIKKTFVFISFIYVYTCFYNKRK